MDITAVLNIDCQYHMLRCFDSITLLFASRACKLWRELSPAVRLNRDDIREMIYMRENAAGKLLNYVMPAIETNINLRAYIVYTEYKAFGSDPRFMRGSLGLRQYRELLSMAISTDDVKCFEYLDAFGELLSPVHTSDLTSGTYIECAMRSCSRECKNTELLYLVYLYRAVSSSARKITKYIAVKYAVHHKRQTEKAENIIKYAIRCDMRFAYKILSKCYATYTLSYAFRKGNEHYVMFTLKHNNGLKKYIELTATTHGMRRAARAAAKLN